MARAKSTESKFNFNLIFLVKKRMQVYKLQQEADTRRSQNFEVQSVLSDKKRIFDGTSEKELMKAMSTYLNQTGAGDYNLPNLIGDKIHIAGKVTNPNWSF